MKKACGSFLPGEGKGEGDRQTETETDIHRHRHTEKGRKLNRCAWKRSVGGEVSSLHYIRQYMLVLLYACFIIIQVNKQFGVIVVRINQILSKHVYCVPNQLITLKICVYL